MADERADAGPVGAAKAALASHAALCAEADIAVLDAERRAMLLRKAGTLEAEGLNAVAVNSARRGGQAVVRGHGGQQHSGAAQPGEEVPVRGTKEGLCDRVAARPGA